MCCGRTPALLTLSDVTQIGEKIPSVPLRCLIKLATAAVLGCQCLDRFYGQSSSIKQIKKGKRKWMDLNYYLSMACLIVLCNGDCASHSSSLFLLPFFCSLDGKKEFTQTDAPSTLTTVRRLHITTFCLLHACIWSCVSYLSALLFFYSV